MPAFRNPQSAIRNPKYVCSPLPAPRSGLSLTEVLIAMGILTLGLLGVAVLFPVGSYYMQKAEIADRGSAIGQAVMSDIVARGMLNPSAWYTIVPPAGGVGGQSFPSDGKYSPVPPPVTPNKVRGTFTRPFALSLAEALVTQPAATSDPTLIGKQFGSAFVIDPMGVAGMSFPGIPPQPSTHGPAAMFPASGYISVGYYPTSSTLQWYSWFGGSKNGFLWPIRRVTFRQPSTGWQMDGTMAEHYFRGNDDLATDLPDRDDRPASQNWDATNVNGASVPLARQWTGDYSWIVTVAPATNAARNGMARNPEGNSYDVSVVVFYKRVLPDDPQTTYAATGSQLWNYLTTMSENERAVRAAIVSTGLNGGELLLTDWGDNSSKSPFDGLRGGQWIMLCGPHRNSTASDPRFALNWYQVLSIDTDGTGITGFDRTKQRVVAVRGPQWAWQPGNLTYNDDLSNNLCVAICPGAVAVHSKTIRLESPRSSSVAFGAGGDPKLNPPQWVVH